jgi:hypothetical protein
MAIGLSISQVVTSAGAVAGDLDFAGAVLLGNRLGVVSVNIWNYWPLHCADGGRIVLQTMSRVRRGAPAIRWR